MLATYFTSLAKKVDEDIEGILLRVVSSIFFDRRRSVCQLGYTAHRCDYDSLVAQHMHETMPARHARSVLCVVGAVMKADTTCILYSMKRVEVTVSAPAR